MAGRTRVEEIKIWHRRHQVARLYLQGITQWEIAERLKVDPAQVCRDLKALQEEWRASATAHLDERKAQELAKIDELERTAREAWERSCQPAETLHAGTTKGRTDKRGKPLPDLVKSYKTVHGQAGDPRFLDRIAWCIDERCKILGLLRERVEHSGKDGGPIEQVVIYVPDNGREPGNAPPSAGAGEVPGEPG